MNLGLYVGKGAFVVYIVDCSLVFGQEMNILLNKSLKYLGCKFAWILVPAPFFDNTFVFLLFLFFSELKKKIPSTFTWSE